MKYGLIGERLGHSFSRQIHNMLGEDDYELVELAKNEVDDWIEATEWEGLNVTIPYKKVAYKHCIPDETARAIGCVNTLVRRDGNIYGYNTDIFGFLYMVKSAGIELMGQKVAIFGSGATTKTATYAAFVEGAQRIIIVSRKRILEDEFFDRYDNIELITYDDIHSYRDADIVINTTPVGMYPDMSSKVIDLRLFTDLRGVIDVVYNPIRTTLMLQAKQMNIPFASGIYMLVVQAYYAQMIWKDAAMFSSDIHIANANTTDSHTKDICRVDNTLDSMNDIHDKVIYGNISESTDSKALAEILEDNHLKKMIDNISKQKLNIVLIGMPGCGKSTIAKALAKQMNRSCFDTDEEFEKRFCMTPAESIETEGEAVMRQKESQIVSNMSYKLGAVIATGGGVPLLKENREALLKNGLIVWLQRDIDKLDICNRPLSLSNNIEKLYYQRHDTYKDFADIVVDNNNDVNTTLCKLKSTLMER